MEKGEGNTKNREILFAWPQASIEGERGAPDKKRAARKTKKERGRKTYFLLLLLPPPPPLLHCAHPDQMWIEEERARPSHTNTTIAWNETTTFT
jgi:hypothetical protein